MGLEDEILKIADSLTEDVLNSGTSEGSSANTANSATVLNEHSLRAMLDRISKMSPSAKSAFGSLLMPRPDKMEYELKLEQPKVEYKPSFSERLRMATPIVSIPKSMKLMTPVSDGHTPKPITPPTPPVQTPVAEETPAPRVRKMRLD
jgi:hypothetical protein